MSKVRNTFLISSTIVSLVLATIVLFSLLVPSKSAYATMDLTNKAFVVEDNQKVWSDTAELEIFKTTYTDSDGNVVLTGGNKKVIAPGVGNVYNFILKNSSEYKIEYTLTASVEMSIDGYLIPIEIKLKDQNNNYQIGTESEYKSIYELNNLDLTQKLDNKVNIEYILEWMWPSDSNNELDTIIGNSTEEITLTLNLNYEARQISEEVKDLSLPIILLIIIVVMFVIDSAIIIYMAIRKRKKNDKK